MGSSGGGGSGGSIGGDQYCLRWNNHQSNLLGVFSQLLRDESLVDVTLACSEGLSIRAHKVVLSACSSYFQALFLDHPSRHPIVILKDVRFAELRTLIEFMYKGEVNVEYCQLSALLKTAESLKVKGLAEMTREYKPTPEQLEPKELVTTRRSRPITPEETPDKPQHSPTALHNWRTCNKSPPQTDKEGEKEKEEKQPPPGASVATVESPSTAECAGALVLNTNHLATCSTLGQPAIYSRLSSPLGCQSLAGPSNLPPVQQVPLSLKKEVDWGGGDGGGGGGGGDEIKPPRDSPTDYSRNPQDSEQLEGAAREESGSSPRLYPCMYCGNAFPHQSKLTRHILSHSLETLKYRERHAPTSAVAPPPLEPVGFLDFGGRPPHEPPDPPDQPTPPVPAPMELELAAEAVGGSGVVLCKFCGKSFPDVSSLIGHLPVHTGDRPFKCEFCGKAFKLRHHMKDHCRVHTGERPFRCALCGKTFSRSTILKAHEKTHYPKYVRKFLSPSPLDAEEDNPH